MLKNYNQQNLKIGILTERNCGHKNHYQITHEWEDVLYQYFSKKYSCEYRFVKNITRPHKTIFGRFCAKVLCSFYQKQVEICPKAMHPPKKRGGQLNFYFSMSPWFYSRFSKYQAIPIYLDVKESELYSVYKMSQKLPFYFVTALDTYNLIRTQYGAENIHYMPLSVADKWLLSEVPEKTVDVVQIGRRSEILHDYMLRYCAKNPKINYIYLESKKSWQYVSTTQGNIGILETRQDFMDLLKKAKVSLVSTPSVESKRFGCIDFFTPRFYESAVNYCRMIGVYTENKEADFLNIKSVCTNVKSYQAFEKALDQSFGKMQSDEKNQFDLFVQENCTSMRVKYMEDIARKWAQCK